MATAETGSIVLILSVDEAKAMSEVFNYVGGPPAGPRGLIDNVNRALREAGITAKSYTHPEDVPFEPNAKVFGGPALMWKDDASV